MEQRVPAGDGSGMSLLFDSLVQRFLNVERYADDIRYVNYCIKCVSLSDILHHRPAVALFFQTKMPFIKRDPHPVLQAGHYSDPVALYSYIHGKGIGTRTAALYVAWAQQFEQRGMVDQAEAVFQKALENEAQPADVVLSEYR